MTNFQILTAAEILRMVVARGCEWPKLLLEDVAGAAEFVADEAASISDFLNEEVASMMDLVMEAAGWMADALHRATSSVMEF